MRTVSVIKEILLHISVICSFTCLIMKVLDWYNPYMDFIGHAYPVEYGLYFAVIVLAVMNLAGKNMEKKEQKEA